MKKRFLILLSFPFLLAAGASSMDITLAKKVVDDFYSGFRTIAVDPESDACAQAVYHCISIFGSPELRMFPDEVNYIKHSFSSSSSIPLQAQLFVSSFRRIMREKPGDFKYSIVSAVPFYEAEWKKSESQASFVYCFVDKTYSGVTFRDTVLLDGNRKIVGICNRAGGNAYTSSSTVTGSIQELELRASKYYTDKKYAEAYSVYQKILARDSENMNANYRLAIMSYKREGCKQYDKKETSKWAMDYLLTARKIADKNRDRANVEKFDNIKYYWN